MRYTFVKLFTFLWLGLAATAVSAQERGALFKAEANGNTLYLFGTMHVGTPDMFPLDPRLEKAVAESQVLALEVDTDAAAARTPQVMQQYAMLKPGSDPYAAMSAVSRERLNTALRGAGMPEQVTSMFKPWMLSAVLAVNEYAQLGFNPSLSTDAYLAKLAKSKKVKIVELETVEYQLGLMDSASEADQRLMLEEALESLHTGEARTDARNLTDAWKKADKDAFDAFMARFEQDKRVSSRFMQDVLLGKRNGPMADKLADMLKQNRSSVAAVGVLHLLGKQGVPELLRAKGIKVQRVY